MKVKTLHRFCVVLLALSMLSVLPMAPSAVMAEETPSGPWTEPVRVDGGPKAARAIESVRLIMDGEGTLHSGWLEDRADGTDCFVTSSNDKGDTWAPDVRVDPIANQQRNQPTTCDIVVDTDDHLYAAYTQWLVLQGWWRVRWARSDDGGETFRDPSDAFPVVDNTLAQEHSAMAITPLGSLNILYIERTPTTSKLFIVRSDDGLNPLPPRAVESGMPEDQSHVQGDIAIGSDGTVYIAYGYRAPREAGIKVARRAPADSSFTITKVYTVTEDAPRSLRPRLAVSEDDVVEVVFDPLDDDFILHIRSDDGGDTFGPPKKVWSSLGPGDVQTNPELAFDPLGRVHMVWTQGGTDPKRVYHSLSHDGTSFTAPTEVAGSWNESLGPRAWEDDGVVLPLDDGSVAVAFSANINSSVGVYFARMDNKAPVVEITAPPDGSLVRGESVQVQGKAADPAGTTGLQSIFVKVGDNDPARLPGATAWEYRFNSMHFPDGPLNITAWATDGFVTGPEDSIIVDVDNNNPPRLNVARPENGTEYIGTVPVVGTAYDEEGFDENLSLEWRLRDEDGWSFGSGLVLQDDNNLDFDFQLDLSDERSGQSQIQVRVSDGDKYSDVSHRMFTLKNLPDLKVTSSDIYLDVLKPEHKEEVTVILNVTNIGVVASGSYDVEFTNYNKPIDFRTGTNLSAGESENLVFTWEAVGGTNKLRFNVDPRFKIEELTKDNNLAELVVEVPMPEDEDGGLSTLTWGIIMVVVVIIVAVLFLVVKYVIPKRGPVTPEGPEQIVYEEGGLYSESSGPYAHGTDAPQVGEEGGQPGGMEPHGYEPPVEDMSVEPTVDSQDGTRMEENITMREQREEYE